MSYEEDKAIKKNFRRNTVISVASMDWCADEICHGMVCSVTDRSKQTFSKLIAFNCTSIGDNIQMHWSELLHVQITCQSKYISQRKSIVYPIFKHRQQFLHTNGNLRLQRHNNMLENKTSRNISIMMITKLDSSLVKVSDNWYSRLNTTNGHLKKTNRLSFCFPRRMRRERTEKNSTQRSWGCCLSLCRTNQLKRHFSRSISQC